MTPGTSQDESKRGEPGPCYELCQDLRHVPTRITGITCGNGKQIAGCRLICLERLPGPGKYGRNIIPQLVKAAQTHPFM